MLTGVVIGFTETSYEVNEDDGEAVARAEVLSGELSREVVVRFNTSDGTATGIGVCKLNYNIQNFYSCLFTPT